MQKTQSMSIFGLGALIVIGLQFLVWFVLYKQVGYNRVTLTLAELTPPLLGLAFIWQLKMKWDDIGVSLNQLQQALLVLAGGYFTTVLVALAFGVAPLGRSYQVAALFENWALVGLGEELFFCGILYNVGKQRFFNGRRWQLVLLVAGIFALWHLPGYIARDLPVSSIAGRLGLNLVSWLIFGTIYALTGNLWLAAFTHASTDYPLTPVITNQPLLGLVFMGVILLVCWWQKRTTTEKLPNLKA